MGVSERRKKETEALRRQVLDVAEDIFVKEGVEHVTMRRIAAEVEYAPTVLYRLFKNKNDLLENLIARGYSGVRERYEGVLKRNDMEPLEALDKILQVYVAYALDHPNHYRMWFDTGILRLDDRSLKMSHGRLQYIVFQTWFDRIEACLDVGLFPGRTSLEVFQVLWSRIHGLISLRIQHPNFPWMPVKRHLKVVLDLSREGSGEG